VTYVGIDPPGLRSLGNDLEEWAAVVAAAAGAAIEPLERHARYRIADAIGTRLSGIARRLRSWGDDLGWRIDAVLRNDSAPVYEPAWGEVAVSRRDLAIGLPPGSPAVVRPSIDRNEVRRLGSADPKQVARYFASLTATEEGLVVAMYPDLVMRLDGAPPAVRYAASDLMIGRRIYGLESASREAGERLRDGGLLGFQRRLLQRYLDMIDGEVAELDRWLAEDRQILLFDPAGDGRVVEVFGDLATSGNLGVVVPGITNDRSNFSVGGGGFRAGARAIHQRAAELGIDGIATIAWLGYDTPDGADAVLRRAAEAGHEDLIAFVAGLDALDGRRHIAVIGHSYGSLVTGLAAAEGIDADEVVFVGSPGTGLRTADDARLAPGGVVWAGLAAGDPIGAGVDITEFLTPQDQLKQTVRRLLDSLKGEDALRDLHHGVNPAHESFGAIEFHTDGSVGHSEYFKPDTVTLDNLLYIIAGMDAYVRIE